MPEAKRFSRDIDNLAFCFAQAPKDNDALVLECGVYLGRTINCIAKMTNGPVYGFDSFEGLPEDWGRDTYVVGSFRVSRLPNVRKNVSLIKGLFENTLSSFLKSQEKPIRFIHIDCDLYSSTRAVLRSCQPYIMPGCVIVFDEYYNYPNWQQGEHKALMEFCAEFPVSFQYISCCTTHEQVGIKVCPGSL